MRFHVTPIYGNGWTNGVHTVKTPEPFQVLGARSQDAIIGTIEKSDQFDGAQFRAMPRHVEQTDYFNCELLLSDGQRLAGYCMIGPKE